VIDVVGSLTGGEFREKNRIEMPIVDVEMSVESVRPYARRPSDVAGSGADTVRV
jgi:hypothetical protein